MVAPGPERGRPGLRETLICGAHLAALWAIAFAQPLLDLLGSNPEFFIARGNTAADILILAIGFTLGPPLVLLLILGLAGLVGRRPFRIVYLGLVALLAAFFAVQILERFLGFDELPALVTGLVAIALGAGLAWGVSRGGFFRAVLDVLSVAPIVVLAIFIFTGGTSRLILPQDEKVELADSIGGQVPVVMVIFDEFPAATLMDERGAIDRRRFPGFARLARSSTWYPNATTVADYTARAVPAIMTGLVPDGSKLPIALDQPHSIFTLLGRSYSMNVREAITRLCPESLCQPDAGAHAGPGLTTRLKSLIQDLKYVEGRLVLPSDLAAKLPEVSTTFGDFGGIEGLAPHKRAGAFARDLFAPPSPRELAEFVNEIPADGRTLSLIHMELPHEPFRFLPSGRSYNDTKLSFLNTPSGQAWAVGPSGIATLQQRHYLQTGYADRLIDTLITRLQREGIWEQAMVVVTADHGISFEPKVPRRMAEEENLAAVANVPLFIKYPQQRRGRVSEQPVKTIDIVPTIAAELGIDDVYETDGEPIPRQAGSDALGSAEVEVVNGRSETVTLPITEMIAQRQEILAKARKNLGTAGLAKLGPRPDLVGQPAPAFRLPLEGEPTASLDAPGLFSDVDLDADPLPAFVTGSLDGVEAGEIIVVAVNGEIAATTRSFLFDGDVRFAVVVPQARLRPGPNEVTIFGLDPAGDLVGLASSTLS